MSYTDSRTGRPVGDVPSTVPDSTTGAGEPDTPDYAAQAAAQADAKAAADAAGLARAGARQDADTKRRQV